MNGNDSIEAWTINQPTFFYEAIGLVDRSDLIVRLSQNGMVETNIFAYPIELDGDPANSIYCVQIPWEGPATIDIDVALSHPLRFEYYVAAPKRRESSER